MEHRTGLPLGRECDEHSPTVGTTSQADGPDEAFKAAVLCPLCLASPVVDPVVLHYSRPAAQGPKDRATTSCCVACKDCAARWAPLYLQQGEAHDCPLCGEAMEMHDSQFPALVELSALPARLTNAVVRPRVDGCTENNEEGDSTKVFALSDAIEEWKRRATEQHRQGTPTSGDEEADSVVCGVCEENKGGKLCLQCDFALCEDCQTATHARGRFRLHEVLPIAEARRKKKEAAANAAAENFSTQSRSQGCGSMSQEHMRARRRLHRSCALHTTQSLDLYCRTCSSCICVTCCFGGDHKGDDVVPLADMADESRDVVQRMSEEMRQTAQEAARTCEGLKELEPQYAALVNGVEGEIRSTFADLRAALTRREEDLVAELKASATATQGGMEAQACLTGAIRTALSNSAEKLGAFLGDTDNVTLMELLPTVRSVHKRLHSLAKRLSGEASCAQATLSARLSPHKQASGRQQGSPTRAALPLAAFRLFAEEACEGEPSTAHPVAEYAKLLSSLGLLTVQSRYPLPDDTNTHSSQRRSESVVTAVEAGTAHEGAKEVVPSRRGRDAEQRALGEEESRCLPVSIPSASTTPADKAEPHVSVRAAAPIAAQSVREEEQSLVEGNSSVSIAPPSSKIKSIPTVLSRPPSSGLLPTTVLDVGARRTEAHSCSKPASPAEAANGEWPLFGATRTKPVGVGAAVAEEPNSGLAAVVPLSGRKRLLDFQFDRTFAETLNVSSTVYGGGGDNGDRPSHAGSRLERFSNSSLFGNRESRQEEPAEWSRDTFTWEPVTKVGRLDTAMDAFISKTKSATVSVTPEKQPMLAEALSTASSSNTATAARTNSGLQLRI